MLDSVLELGNHHLWFIPSRNFKIYTKTVTYSEVIFLLSILQTASHLPYNRNGFKFFTSTGGLGKNDIKDILERAANVYEKFSVENLEEPDKEVSVKKVDYMEVYTSDLVAAVRRSAGNIGILLLYFLPV